MVSQGERINALEERFAQLQEKKEDPEQFVSALLKDVFSKLGEDHAGDLCGFISKQINEYIHENYVSNEDLKRYVSKEDMRDLLSELLSALQDEVGVNAVLFEKEVRKFLP